MDDEVYKRAVEGAHAFRDAALPWESRRSSEVAAEHLLAFDRDTLVYHLKTLIKFSENEKEAWDTLALIAQTLLRDGKLLPPPLAQWVADVLGEERSRPKRGADGTGTRDAAIQLAVEHIATTFGLTPTRAGTAGGRAGEGQSACDAVAQAWALGYKTVERIWNERIPEVRRELTALLSESPKK